MRSIDGPVENAMTVRWTVAMGALLLTLAASACAGNGPGTVHQGALAPGSLARAPVGASQMGPESVGVAGTGPAGSDADVGDGTYGW